MLPLVTFRRPKATEGFGVNRLQAGDADLLSATGIFHAVDKRILNCK
jgi:hypothetical protein